MTQPDENLTGVAALLNPKTDYYQVFADVDGEDLEWWKNCLLYTSPSPRD